MKETCFDKRESKRNVALNRARNYARQGRIEEVKIWFNRANSFAPISPIQKWKLKMIIGKENFQRIEL